MHRQKRSWLQRNVLGIKISLIQEMYTETISQPFSLLAVRDLLLTKPQLIANTCSYTSTTGINILGVHDMQQASRKAESGNHEHAVNDM